MQILYLHIFEVPEHMITSVAGDHRIRAAAPTGWVVADKTGNMRGSNFHFIELYSQMLLYNFRDERII